MKTIITLALLIIAMPLQSQSNRIYSVSINGGGFFPIEKLSNSIETGYNFGIDLETRKSSFALFGSGKVNQVKAYRWNFDSYGMPIMEKWTYTIGEVSAGGRWYLGNSKPLSGSVDLALSIYTGNYFQKIPWGIQPGFGGNVPISRKLTANLNVKINVLEVDKWETYAGVYLGLRFSFGNLNESEN